MNKPHSKGKLRIGQTAYPSQTLLSDDPASPGVVGHDSPSYGGFMVAESVSPPNARRLVACWNACDGFTTEQLENILMLGDTMLSRFQARNEQEIENLGEIGILRDHLSACVDGWKKGDDVAGPMRAAMALLEQSNTETPDKISPAHQKALATLGEYAVQREEHLKLLHRVTQSTEWSCMEPDLQDDIAKALGMDKTPALPVPPPPPDIFTQKYCEPMCANEDQQPQPGGRPGYICRKCGFDMPF